MKFCALGMDHNNRSYATEREVHLTQVSETEWLSEKQDGKSWSISTRQPGEPFDGGPMEMHLINFPSFVFCMQGHLETTPQDGQTCRLAPGDGVFIDALHHSVFGPSRVPVDYITLGFAGTRDVEFK
jgi:uncharacterized cupin superfamily protein